LHNCINFKLEIKPSCKYKSIYAPKNKLFQFTYFWSMQIENLKFCTTTSIFVFILPCFHLDPICCKRKNSSNHTLIWYGCLVSFFVYITNIWTLIQSTYSYKQKVLDDMSLYGVETHWRNDFNTLQQKVSLYAKWFHWILNAFIGLVNKD
jgi:hypothetical protein